MTFWVYLMSKKKSIYLFIKNWGEKVEGEMQNSPEITQMNPARNQLWKWRRD